MKNRGKKLWKKAVLPVWDYYRDCTVQKKISLAFLILMAPLILMIIIWFFMVMDASDNYEKAIRTTAIVSEFNLDFKQNYDYKIYLITTGNKTFADQDPESDIMYARDIVARVEDSTDNAASRECLQKLRHYFDVLEKYTGTIRENVLLVGKYDENRELWENGVQLATRNIEQTMTKILYYENQESAAQYQRITKIINRLEIITIVLLIIMAAMAVVMTTIIPHSISRPIAYLANITKKVAGGDLEVRAHITHGEDVKVLADALNRMIKKIQSLIDNVLLEQMNLREAELEILQMQINPHFLYNTLDTIIWLAEAGKKEEVVDMVKSLSDFFRSSLNSGKDIVSIASEAQHISSYLQIQQVRYQDILDYEIDIPEEVKEYLVPKITLQPLVENALYHGIKYKRGKGKITVSGRVQEGVCILSVKDDGVGMSKERLRQVQGGLTTKIEDSNDFYGLYNVNERIRLKFGNAYGLHIDSIEQEGTIVEIWLPLTCQS